MSKQYVLFIERYNSKIVRYIKQDPLKIKRLEPQSSFSVSIFVTITSFLREVLLPRGYPDTVSSDYLEYQIWDTLQAFCSTITGSFTTRAILKGVGVGDAEASALSATVTWIMKDGSGMIGRIFFAWWKGSKLDCDSKKWRLFADFLNDLAMAIELVVPYFSARSMEILCLTSTMKSIVGIAGGATRASITQHQAIIGNMAEVSAKDGTQETVVNLVASITSIYMLNVITNPTYELPLIWFLMMLHLYFNFKAVRSLIFNDLNESRMVLLMTTYCNMNTVARPISINHAESVILGQGKRISDICGFKIKIGCPLSRVMHLYNFEEMQKLLQLHREQCYIVVPDVQKRCIYIALEKGCDTQSVLISYFHGVMLAIATCVYNDIPLYFDIKRQRNYSSPVARLKSFMNNIEKDAEHETNMSVEELRIFNNFLEPEINMFFTSVQINGWNINGHSMYLEQWRIDWKSFIEKND